ncbi:D-xylose-binding protein [Leadbettera azotonutricia ZAS-9]|uniref:D-xylose-binding protein n=1 Tax=Leadbettera azotonutricia (strain ATCC BAA-888 / DSM 13862 / ZAS-9) TaxID=545695 RepID=F5YBE5_LEAAZ|nr:D-xylose-binding protein [Leadbettera azotonutricia ZAS-9]
MKAVAVFFGLLLLAACTAAGKAGPAAISGTAGSGGNAAPGNSSQKTESGAKDAEARPVIGFSIATDTFITERWNKDLKVFSGAAQELGADVIVQLSAGGTREQIAQINYMINQKIDILVVIAHDTEMISGVIRQIRNAGIPVIAYDRMIVGVPVDAYISFDSLEVGRQYGLAVSEAVPQGKYLVVNGSLHDVNSFEISKGLHQIIDPLVNAGAVTVEQEIYLEEWSFDEALERIGAIFEETTDFDAIICGNDNIASAAIQLLSERRLAGKVAVVGQDAELISCQHIVEGLQLMTVYKPIGKLASRAARLAMAIKSGQDFPPDTFTDNQSGTPIPSYIEKPIAVNKDNMDIVIRDGFHSREDIYRNVMD